MKQRNEKYINLVKSDILSIVNSLKNTDRITSGRNNYCKACGYDYNGYFLKTDARGNRSYVQAESVVFSILIQGNKFIITHNEQ